MHRPTRSLQVDGWKSAKAPQGRPPPESGAGDAGYRQDRLAYRIRGAKSEKYDGLIQAHSREEAEAKAYALFGAITPAEKVKVYVRET